MESISVVVPVFNEETLVEELLTRINSVLRTETNNYKIIVIDDGSKDKTWVNILNMKEKIPNIIGIKFSRNFGQHYAISAGLANCNSDWVVVMDGDLQDRPEVIPDLINKAREGFDIVFVNRENRPEGILYRLAQKLFYFMLNSLSGLNLDSRQANFSIINRNVVENFNKYSETTRFYASTVKWLGFNRSEIFANHGLRFNGKPSYTLKKRIQLAGDIILSFSERPLKFAISLGIACSIISLVSVSILIWTALTQGYEVLGWASVIISIIFFSGVTLTVLGIMGLYLAKVFTEVKNRPLYIISESTDVLKIV
jgi:glycosyltransferase involved in cell wall biosynthesis